MHRHHFVWNGHVVSLIYSIESVQGVRKLNLEDVQAISIEVANAVPDHMIEFEAGAIAAEHGAMYM